MAELPSEHFEFVDIAAWRDMVEAAPAPFRSASSLSVRDQGGALIISSRLALGHFHSVIGLGLAVAATEEQLDEIEQIYRDSGSGRYMVVLAPDAEPAALEGWLFERGMRQVGVWERIVRESVAAPAAPNGEDPIEFVSAESASEWAAFIDRIYRLSNSPWLLALVGRPGWHHALIREKGEIAAVRSLFIAGTSAWLGIDAPVPGLMTARFDRDFALCEGLIQKGVSEGVATFCTDVEAPNPEQIGPSYEGFWNLGFRPAYLRRLFVKTL